MTYLLGKPWNPGAKEYIIPNYSSQWPCSGRWIGSFLASSDQRMNFLPSEWGAVLWAAEWRNNDSRLKWNPTWLIIRTCTAVQEDEDNGIIVCWYGVTLPDYRIIGCHKLISPKAVGRYDNSLIVYVCLVSLSDLSLNLPIGSKIIFF